MSIDAPNMQVDNKTMSLNFNYIDTYVEYFSEIIFNYKNAIPETKNRHHKELQQHNHLNIIFQSLMQPVASILSISKTGKQRFDYNDKDAYQFIKEINPPPPKLS